MKALRQLHLGAVEYARDKIRLEEAQRMEYRLRLSQALHVIIARVENAEGRLIKERRIENQRAAFREFLARPEGGSSVAIETIGNRYWIVDEIGAAGMIPKLVNARGSEDDNGWDEQVHCPPYGYLRETYMIAATCHELAWCWRDNAPA